MCLLALGHRVVPDFPLVLAANRDEYYDRPTAPPGLLCDVPRVVGGRDLRAGGTWLGVNEANMVVAVTNRYTGTPPDPGLPTSRGQLCLDALSMHTAADAAAFVAESARGARYNTFNLMAADPNSAWLVTNVDDVDNCRLEPGWYVVANAAVEDPCDPRVQRTHALLPTENTDALLGKLQRLCRDHGICGAGEADAVCVHRELAGTRSSTILLVAADSGVEYWHAHGAPCRTAYCRVTLPWIAKDWRHGNE